MIEEIDLFVHYYAIKCQDGTTFNILGRDSVKTDNHARLLHLEHQQMHGTHALMKQGYVVFLDQNYDLVAKKIINIKTRQYFLKTDKFNMNGLYESASKNWGWVDYLIYYSARSKPVSTYYYSITSKTKLTDPDDLVFVDKDEFYNTDVDELVEIHLSGHNSERIITCLHN